MAKGSLPAETTRYAYVADLSLVKSFSGLAGYVYEISYDAYSRVQLQTLGAGSNRATVTNIFDDHTSRLKNQLVNRSTTLPKEVDEQAYDYDLVGNITRKTSKRLGATTPAETQCYRYDGLARLTEAWTGTDACATAPTDANKSMVGNTIGAGSAYWTSWQIDLIGNRSQQIQHNLTAGGADTKTIYTYNGNGQNKPHTLTSTTTTGATTATTSYAYDNAGNTTGRNAAQGNQTLTWDDAGKLTTVTGGTSGNNTFIYDADGNLLLQKEPGKNTLYLPGQQLTLNTATNVVTGSRSLALPGGGTAIRTGSGTAYTFAIADHQGTPTLYLDSTAQNPTWRQYTPYGAPRGATVATPDNRGFLNKPMSPTGLTTVGARSYDPTLGRFISVDPLQDAAQPQQWNGYSYANNTPVTSSDPTGLIPADCLEFDCRGYDPRPIAPDDKTRGAGGCPRGCGTTANINWGRMNGKSSTKSGRSKTTDAEDLVTAFAAGKGGEYRFTDDDFFAEQLRKDRFLQDGLSLIRGQIEAGKTEGDFYKSLGESDQIPGAVIDYFIIAEYLMVGETSANLERAMVGSYYVTWTTSGVGSDGQFDVELVITNRTSVASGTRIPYFGYQDWYNKYFSNPILPMLAKHYRTQTQTVVLHERV
ncbi:RHS repeat-associated core domain-containing protein [Micromonospora sp. WMMD961]|uniref:RHS repeat-associated core domain-containing protein n=1 Tax=Micromonospora sp. WMMD961 TaxID=3016100 RepID=UPI002416B174|nr:RHS repeat-associated core domain-containing protein [Micromonospora sp. WMMD961]MDG4780049.1 RHS repeat-associated core domain-containing protein [Micromonospora sp. WMMD961]